jgi:hypothetical protein
MALRAERGAPSFEQALRFLSGDRSVEHIEEEEEDDDAEDGLQGLGPMSLGADILRNNINVPPPRRGGACFGPSGEFRLEIHPDQRCAGHSADPAHSAQQASCLSSSRQT